MTFVLGDGFQKWNDGPSRPLWNSTNETEPFHSLALLHPSFHPRVLCGYLDLNRDRRMNRKCAAGVRWSAHVVGIIKWRVGPVGSMLEHEGGWRLCDSRFFWGVPLSRCSFSQVVDGWVRERPVN